MNYKSKVSGWKYDVFLSFRGADTRRGFIQDLYDALVGAGIDTFRDDDEIRHGEHVGTECLTAIRESRLSVVVLSKGFASSAWCLDELVHILKCKDEMNHKVWPIFYNVRATEVEEQSGEHAKAFLDHQERYANEMSKVKEWRNALTQVSHLKGLKLQNYESSDEARIEEIVKEISFMVGSKKLSLPVHSVGLDSRANDVIFLLANKYVDKCIVGICGMGGIGKTTVARKVYNAIYDNFEGSCFLDNVGEKSGPEGIRELRKELFSKVLDRKLEKIENTEKIEERLRGKRVLIVLDDVLDQIQFSKILENPASWLSEGSRIIITSRSNNLVEQQTICYRQYDVCELDQREALQLLLLHAFDEQQPPEDILKCAKELVGYVGGVPLALEVLGSSLSGQGIDASVWKDKLDKLKVLSNRGIQNVLEISYNSLDDDDVKFLFLDIACFFVGKNKDYVMCILKECGRFTIDGIRILKKRCLLKVSSDNKLSMHTLVRDMGRAIVRRENPNNPGKRSRIWNHDDAKDVLECETGSVSVQGLMLSQQESDDSFSTDSFKRMKLLRILQLDYAHFVGSWEYISKKLCWLRWRGFPLAYIPGDFHLRNLVALDMRYSSLKLFSEQIKVLGKLKCLNLSHSHELLRTPDFEGMLNLETLLLKDCISLDEIHRSIGCLSCLVFLNLKGCKSLRNLPRNICDLQALETLNVSHCSKFEEFPEELGNMKSLAELVADGTSIRTLPFSIRNLENLKSLSIQECSLLCSPKGEKSILISFLPASLKSLDFRYCNISDDMIPEDFQVIPNLEDLKLCGNNFTSLPDSIGSLSRLKRLWLSKCKELQSVTLQEHYEIPELLLKGCHKLKNVKGYFNLEAVEIKTVENFLKSRGFLNEESITKSKMHVINTLTETHTFSSTIQAVCERGIYSIFLPGNEIPRWCFRRNEGDSISVQVPWIGQDYKIIGFAICAIYAWEEPDLSCYFFPYITVTNKTKMFNWVHEPKVAIFSIDVKQEMMWQSYWMFGDCFEKDCTDTSDTRWLFWNETEAGDQIDLTVDFGYGIVVRKCGIHFLYQCDQENVSHSNDWGIISSATSRHHRTFARPDPQWFAINNHKITVNRRSDSFPKGVFSEYSSYLQKNTLRRTRGAALERRNCNSSKREKQLRT